MIQLHYNIWNNNMFENNNALTFNVSSVLLVNKIWENNCLFQNQCYRRKLSKSLVNVNNLKVQTSALKSSENGTKVCLKPSMGLTSVINRTVVCKWHTTDIQRF